MSEDGGALPPEVNAAVAATSAAYTEDASIDVDGRLRHELAARGQDADDETVDRWARLVRAGHVEEARAMDDGLGIDPT